MRFLLLAVAFVGATPLLSKIMAGSAGTAVRERDGHPRQAHVSPWKEGYARAKEALICAYQGIGSHGSSLLAAGVAFYALFALFPGLGAATWIFGLISEPATIQAQLNNLKDVLPEEAWKLIEQQLHTLTSRNTSLSLAGIFSLLVALYSARTAASSMMEALNTIYGVKETRGFLVTNGLAILFTLVAIAILLIGVAAMVVAPIVFSYAGLSSVPSAIIRFARWPALAVVMVLALALTYRYAPDRENARWKWLTWGSAAATVIWLIASAGFSWYVAAFNSYDRVYGSIGAVVVLLFWFWITAFSALLGAELDNAIERMEGVPPVMPPARKA
jgi:membrane protein